MRVKGGERDDVLDEGEKIENELAARRRAREARGEETTNRGREARCEAGG